MYIIVAFPVHPWSCSQTPPSRRERVWHTSSDFWGLMTWHIWILSHQSDSRHLVYYVMIMWHCAIAVYCMCVRAIYALLCQTDALSCQSHDMLHPVCPRNHSMYTRPFSSLSVGLGTKLSMIPLPFCCVTFHLCPVVAYDWQYSQTFSPSPATFVL